MTAELFLPQGYKVPKKSTRFVKLQAGEARLRILDRPLMGWVAWKKDASGKRKPLRRVENDFKPTEFDKGQDPKHFWAMPVYDYAAGRVKVWELTQVSIQSFITKLSKQPKWGPPFDYDLVINATGEGKEREYSTIPEPKEALPDEAAQEWERIKKTFAIEALLDGKDPFGDEAEGSGGFYEGDPADDDIPF